MRKLVNKHTTWGDYQNAKARTDIVQVLPDGGRCSKHDCELVSTNLPASSVSVVSSDGSISNYSETAERLLVCPQCPDGSAIVVQERNEAQAEVRRLRAELGLLAARDVLS